MLYELEAGGDFGSIGLVLRAIYDGGNVDKFVQALERNIRCTKPLTWKNS